MSIQANEPTTQGLSAPPSSSGAGSGSVTKATGGRDLVTGQGNTSIADVVVQKIVGMAARQVSGVYNLGGGGARAFGAVREMVPGTSGPSVTQGVTVEVGERQAAVDIDVMVEYGVAIADLAAAIRRNVINAVQQMTGLEVTEVNITVDDIHMPGDDDGGEQQPTRVQ